jgi:hypothetical protein
MIPPALPRLVLPTAMLDCGRVRLRQAELGPERLEIYLMGSLAHGGFGTLAAADFLLWIGLITLIMRLR